MHDRKPMSILSAFRKVLVLCPHTDDEFGCAGTLARLLDEGVQVHYQALSSCEESLPDGFPPETLVSECRAAMHSLGVPPSQVHIGPFKVRYFPRDRQAILEHFVRLKAEIAPDLVLLPSSFDTHQDHRTVYEEGFRAFKDSTILGYELPQNLIAFNNSAFVALTQPAMARKVASLSAYRSQEHRPYSNEEFIYGLARVRGVQCGAPFAEAFELIRLIIR